MKRYRLVGWGRKVGAIGISGFFAVDLEAKDEADARLKVYDHYEHISQLECVEKKVQS